MKVTRRKFIKNVLGSFIGLLALSGLTYYYAKYIEPKWLTIQRFNIINRKIPKSFDQLKIVQFSDTHIGFHYDLEQFSELVRTINKLKPDLILFTGDLVDTPQHHTFTNELPVLLGTLHAPLGKYWIYGNHDHGGFGTGKIREVMDKGGFQLLQNEHTVIEKQQASIVLAGLDDVMLGQPNIERTMRGVQSEMFSILMVHEPDGADTYQTYNPSIQLSGHSHGGQIQLPFAGYLVTPPMAEKYVEGHYRLPQGTDLFVSRGVGTTRLPYRFFCRPEISVFRLSSERV